MTAAAKKSERRQAPRRRADGLKEIRQRRYYFAYFSVGRARYFAGGCQHGKNGGHLMLQLTLHAAR